MTSNTLPAHWRPDPGWPPVIIDLAAQIALKQDVRFALHDVWEQHALPHPYHDDGDDDFRCIDCPILEAPLGMIHGFRSSSAVAASATIGLILGDGDVYDAGGLRWRDQCLAQLRGTQ